MDVNSLRDPHIDFAGQNHIQQGPLLGPNRRRGPARGEAGQRPNSFQREFRGNDGHLIREAMSLEKAQFMHHPNALLYRLWLMWFV
jgi:hypothetical protein